MESDAIPKIDLTVDGRQVGQLGLAQLSEANENTDYSSDSESEADEVDNSEGDLSNEATTQKPPKRSSARIQLTNQAGNLHKRMRQT